MIPNMKVHKTPSGESHLIRAYGQTHMTRLSLVAC